MPQKKLAAPEQPAWLRVALALTLVPLLAGMLLILAWAMDWDLTGRLEDQVQFGLLLMFISFTLSNLFQKRLGLFLGWLLISIADIVFLSAVANVAFQIGALLLSLAGLFFLGREYVHRIRANASQ